MNEDTAPSTLSDYVVDLFAADDDLLIELRAEMQRRDMPDIAIDPEEGRILQVLLAAIGARHVLEIGTLGGYSAIRMARVLPPGGKLITIEREPVHAEVARTFIQRAGLADVVEVRLGDALESLKKLIEEKAGPFDVCFIDADKAGYPSYLSAARQLVRPGGLILGDNAFLGGRVLEAPPDDLGAVAMREFNRAVATDPELTATILPVRDGLLVAAVAQKAESDAAPPTDPAESPEDQ